MQREDAGRMRAGAIALGVSGLLFTTFPIVRPFASGTMTSAPADFARTVSSTAWIVAHLLALAGFIFLTFGLLALFSHLAHGSMERRAIIALVLSLSGIALTLTVLGVETYALRALGQLYNQGHTDTISNAMQTALYGGSDIFALMLGLLLLAVGAILFATAIWKDGRLPRWSAVILAVGLTFWFPLFPQSIRVLDGLLIGIGGIWLSWRMWEQSAADTMVPPTPLLA